MSGRQADVDVLVRQPTHTPPAWAVYTGVVISVLVGVSQIANIAVGGAYGWRQETSLQAAQSARADDRLTSLESNFNSLRGEIGERFQQEANAREQVDKNSEFRRSTMIEQLTTAVDLMNKRVDAQTAFLQKLATQAQDDATQTAILKGLMMQRYQLQSAPGGVGAPLMAPESTKPKSIEPPAPHEEAALLPW